MLYLHLGICESDPEFIERLGAEAREGGNLKNKQKTNCPPFVSSWWYAWICLFCLGWKQHHFPTDKMGWVFLRFPDWHAPCIGELLNGCDGSFSARVYHPHIVNILVWQVHVGTFLGIIGNVPGLYCPASKCLVTPSHDGPDASSCWTPWQLRASAVDEAVLVFLMWKYENTRCHWSARNAFSVEHTLCWNYRQVLRIVWFLPVSKY